MIFQGIRTSIAQKPYSFVIFQGGPGPQSPLLIRTCETSNIINYFRYKFPELFGASTWIYADDGHVFDFSEIDVRGNAHLAFKAKTGDNTDSATIIAGKVAGDKTGKSFG